jgi:ankyrin repeat protein
MSAGLPTWALAISSSEGNHKDVVELLLLDKAEVNSQDRKGNALLQVATVQGRTDVMELLRQYGGHRLIVSKPNSAFINRPNWAKSARKPGRYWCLNQAASKRPTFCLMSCFWWTEAIRLGA